MNTQLTSLCCLHASRETSQQGAQIAAGWDRGRDRSNTSNPDRSAKAHNADCGLRGDVLIKDHSLESPGGRLLISLIGGRQAGNSRD